MQIQTIYDHYRIMPTLQTHMYRVAAVAQTVVEAQAKMLAGAQTETLAIPDVISAALLHDMGNIIKFDLSKFPEFLAPQGPAYWQQVQAEYVEKYGPNEHTAAVLIAKEIGVSDRVQQLIDGVSFHYLTAHLQGHDLEQDIVAYADCRVTPYGIVSLADRLADLQVRYSKRYPTPEDQVRRQAYGQSAHELEQRLFTGLTLAPQDLSDAALQPRLENLPKFEIMQCDARVLEW